MILQFFKCMLHIHVYLLLFWNHLIELNILRNGSFSKLISYWQGTLPNLVIVLGVITNCEDTKTSEELDPAGKQTTSYFLSPLTLSLASFSLIEKKSRCVQPRAAMGGQQSQWALGSFPSAILRACLSSTASRVAVWVLITASASGQVDEAGHRARRVCAS